MSTSSRLSGFHVAELTDTNLRALLKDCCSLAPVNTQTAANHANVNSEGKEREHSFFSLSFIAEGDLLLLLQAF